MGGWPVRQMTSSPSKTTSSIYLSPFRHPTQNKPKRKSGHALNLRKVQRSKPHSGICVGTVYYVESFAASPTATLRMHSSIRAQSRILAFLLKTLKRPTTRHPPLLTLSSPNRNPGPHLHTPVSCGGLRPARNAQTWTKKPTTTLLYYGILINTEVIHQTDHVQRGSRPADLPA